MENSDEARIKSRPLYAPIVIRESAAFHLFIEEGDGEKASDLLSVFNQCPSSVKSWLSISGSDITAFLKMVRQKEEVSLDEVDQGAFSQSLKAEELSLALASLPIAAQVYVSGTESFMWDVHNILTLAGLLPTQISLMEPTSLIRRVFCTHCYTVMEKVTHTPVDCTGCHRPLLVRDHFSRVHGAYVGLNINAEDENDIPEQEALT